MKINTNAVFEYCCHHFAKPLLIDSSPDIIKKVNILFKHIGTTKNIRLAGYNHIKSFPCIIKNAISNPKSTDTSVNTNITQLFPYKTNHFSVYFFVSPKRIKRVKSEIQSLFQE